MKTKTKLDPINALSCSLRLAPPHSVPSVLLVSDNLSSSLFISVQPASAIKLSGIRDDNTLDTDTMDYPQVF